MEEEKLQEVMELVNSDNEGRKESEEEEVKKN